MKALTVIRRLGKAGRKLRAPLALLYLLLSMAAAWHAPHDIRSGAPLSIQASDVSTSKTVADKDAYCTLCSWQSLHQQTATAIDAPAISMPLAALTALLYVDAPVPGFFPAHPARGPPSV